MDPQLGEKVIWPGSLKKEDEAVLILSGGMDSAVLLRFLEDKGVKVHCLSFDYGSRHNQKEIGMAVELAGEWGQSHQVIKLDFIHDLFSSALLKNQEDLPHGHYEEVTMRKTVVPFRNGIMLSVAVGLAEDRNIPFVFIGSHLGDHSIYPDCRIEFTQAFSRASSLGTYQGVQVVSPFNTLDKREIAQIGKALRVDFTRTWTCYQGDEIHCGLCGACSERKYALGYELGQDPTVYKA